MNTMCWFRQTGYFVNKLSFIVWIGTLLLWTANSIAATAEQLRQLEIRIQALEAQMHNTRTEYGRLQNLLKNSEENIGAVSEYLEKLHEEWVDKQHTLADLKKQKTTQLTELEEQRQVLAQQVRAAYMVGRQDYLKLWLNQQDPFSIGRVLTYYDYFNKAHVEQIQAINTLLTETQILEQQITQETQQLAQLVSHQNTKKDQLKLSHNERQVILAQLENTLQNQDKELKRLKEDKRQLEALLGTLGEAFKGIPQPHGEQVNLAQLKGQLNNPVRGRIIRHFGDALVGNLKWQGLLFDASQGEKIYAVAAGRVAFAQWFRHLGLLIIIDHGQGYMSLYAHNQSIYVKTGAWIKARTVIASVGNSGGRHTHALYFEIRYQGIPVDPLPWLRH